MILVPQRYSPETLITRIEKSPVFGLTQRNWQVRFPDGELYERYTLYIIGPNRLIARPTRPVEKPAISYTGKYLRTKIELIATNPEKERTALTDGEAFRELLDLLGDPSDWGKRREFGRVVRYDFLTRGCIPSLYYLDLMTQKYARFALRRKKEGKLVRGKLPPEVRERILRRDME